MFAGRRRESKEVQVVQSLVFGAGPHAGPPGFGSVFFQPEIPMEPQSGQGKNKHVGLVFGLIATACRRRVRVSAQSDERHTAAKPSRLHQREENNSPVRETASECWAVGPHKEPEEVICCPHCVLGN